MAKKNEIRKGAIIQLNASYPVWDFSGSEDTVIGHTSKEDFAEVLAFGNAKYENDECIELRLLSGEFEDYDCLAINYRDWYRAKYLSPKDLVGRWEKSNE